MTELFVMIVVLAASDCSMQLCRCPGNKIKLERKWPGARKVCVSVAWDAGLLRMPWCPAQRQ